MTSSQPYTSWGRLPGSPQSAIAAEPSGADPGFTALSATLADNRSSLIAYGNGRSYGDSCLNANGPVIDMRALNRVWAFDRVSGIIEAEAGVLLSAILARTMPNGWFLPVTPGTKFVTLGGAVANDVHGKNHHALGAIGCHVMGFELLRSNGTRRWCSPSEDGDLFCATIGGLGLTGLMTRIKLQLIPITSAEIDQIIDPFESLAAFYDLIEARNATHAYTVAWLDTTARNKRGRGILISGNHAPGNGAIKAPLSSAPRLSVPFTPPVPAINGLTLKAFNSAYYYANRRRAGATRVPFSAFFYPLDAIAGWNRLYGPCGLYQHQSVVPFGARQAVTDLLATCEAHGQASFLTVLKSFGTRPSPGLLSFPRPGFTLTLDFPNRGDRTLRLLEQLDVIVLSAGGSINPYKDARMAPETFQRAFPHWGELEHHRDPALQSSFWRRVTSGARLASLSENAVRTAETPA